MRFVDADRLGAEASESEKNVRAVAAATYDATLRVTSKKQRIAAINRQAKIQYDKQKAEEKAAKENDNGKLCPVPLTVRGLTVRGS